MGDASVWGSVADWVTVGLTGVTLILAWAGFSAYRNHVEYEQDRGLAVRLAAAMYRLRLWTLETRLPMLSSHELGKARQELANEQGAKASGVPDQQVSAQAHTNRWRPAYQALKEFENELAAAEATWGEESASAIRKLVVAPIQELQQATREHCDFLSYHDKDDPKERSRLRAIVFSMGTREDPDAFEKRLRASFKEAARLIDDQVRGRDQVITILRGPNGYRVALTRHRSQSV